MIAVPRWSKSGPLSNSHSKMSKIKEFDGSKRLSMPNQKKKRRKKSTQTVCDTCSKKKYLGACACTGCPLAEFKAADGAKIVLK